MSVRPSGFLLGLYTQLDAAHVAAAVAAQIDGRFMAMDVSEGSRILWADVAASCERSTGRAWTTT
jgi:hypothetical protein